eukprot:scaffold55851_cov14-Tisochrysis_lutea.AAC.1
MLAAHPPSPPAFSLFCPAAPAPAAAVAVRGGRCKHWTEAGSLLLALLSVMRLWLGVAVDVAACAAVDEVEGGLGNWLVLGGS